MSLSLSLSRASVQSASTTRILVLPVGGPVPRPVYDQYLAALRRVGSEVPTASLTYHAPSKDTPFKTINWKKGRMLFEFIDGSVPAAEASRAQLTISPPPVVHAGRGGSCTVGAADEDDDDAGPVPMVSAPASLSLSYDWDELQVYKKVMAVLCLCFVPTAVAQPDAHGSLKEAQQQFQDVRAQLLHPGGPFIYKCYAFEGSQLTAGMSEPNWSFFPSTRATPPSAPSTPRAVDDDEETLRRHWDFYMQTCLNDLAAGLLDNFEASIKKLSPHADLRSPLEGGMGGGGGGGAGGNSGSSEAQSRAKKVRPGRQKKYVGDYCLLAADPVGAIKHFKAAADACRNANDTIWHALSLEGQAACLVAQESEKESPAYLDAAVDLYEECLALLARVPYASVLSIEASFRLARYLLAHSRRTESAEVLLRMYGLKMDCSAHDQIGLAVEAAILCHQLGFKRKFGFFLVQAAGLYRELHQSASCHALLKMASPAFRIDGFTRPVLSRHFMTERAGMVPADAGVASRLDGLGALAAEDDGNDDDDAFPPPGDQAELDLWERSFDQSPVALMERLFRMAPSKRRERGYRSGRWVFLQRSLLEHLIFSAKQMGDDELTAACTAFLLRTLHPWLDASYQASIVGDLWAATRMLPLNVRNIDMSGLPVLHALRPLELDDETKPWLDPLAPDQPTANESSGTAAGSGAGLRIDASDSVVDVAEPDSGAMGSCVRVQRAEEAASGDVFLTRPDEDQSKQTARRLRFVCGEALDVEVFLSNPLQVPMLVQHMSLSTSGVPFEAFTASLTLPPETYNQRVLLSGLPRASGTLQIRGVFIRCFNLMHEHQVDATGNGIRPIYDDAESSPYCPDPPPASSLLAPISVRALEIVPPLPRLRISYGVGGNMESSLLLGEQRRACLTLHNVGPMAVADVELFVEAQYNAMSAQSQASYYMQKAELEEIARNTQARDAAAAAAVAAAAEKKRGPFTPSKPAGVGRKLTATGEMTMRKHTATGLTGLFSPGSGGGAAAAASASGAPQPPRRRLVTFDPAALRAQLPLKPGGVIRLHIDITAHTECCGARFLISYAAAPSSRMFRCAVHTVSWKVEKGLQLNNLNIYHHFVSPSYGAANAGGAAAAAASPAQQQQLSPPPSVLSSVSSSSSSSGAVPSASAPQLPASHLSNELDLLSPGDCMLILELSNSSAASFRLTCTVDGSSYKSHGVIIDKNSDKRLILPLPRMSFGDSAKDRYLRRLAHSLSMQAVAAESASATATAAVAIPSWKNDPTYQSLLARFHERVKLTWSSSEESRGALVGMGAGAGAGDADADGAVDVSPLHLERLLPDPLSFESTLTPVEAPATSGEDGDATGLGIDQMAGSPIFRSPVLSRSQSLVVPPPLPLLSSGTRALVGCFHRLSVTLRNESVEPLSVSLSIAPFQEAVNGQWDTQLAHKLLLVGTLTRPVATLLPGQSLTHEVLVCFTAVGRFHFQFVARQREGSVAHSATLASPTSPAPMAVHVEPPAHPSMLLDDGDDPFALLASLARSTAVPPRLSLSTGGAGHSVAPSPMRSTTVRRRSVLSTDADNAHQAAAAAAAFEHLSVGAAAGSLDMGVADRSSFELDEDSDSDSDADEDEQSCGTAAAAAFPLSHRRSASSESSGDLVYRCQNLMVVQACVQEP